MPDHMTPLLFAASPAPLKDAQLYASAYAQASPERRQRVDRLTRMEDKIPVLASEMLLFYALRAAGLREFPPQLTHTGKRKPCLVQGRLHFNLSRSGGVEGWVVCAVADTEVGCDVEQVGDWDKAVARHYFKNYEYVDTVAQFTHEARRERFFRYWTLKESFMKATGLGLSLPLRSFRITLGDTVGVEQSVDPRLFHFQEFADLEGYKCALCTAGEERPLARLCVVDLRDVR